MILVIKTSDFLDCCSICQYAVLRKLNIIPTLSRFSLCAKNNSGTVVCKVRISFLRNRDKIPTLRSTLAVDQLLQLCTDHTV